MKLAATIEIYGYGTSEGVTKSWDTRGRGRAEVARHARHELRQWDGKSETRTLYVDENNHYHPQRLAIHNELMHKYEHRPPQQDPMIQLIAGGTASGKTTAAGNEYAHLRNPAIVNMDMPRADLPEFKQLAMDKKGLLQEEASDIRDKLLMSAMSHNNDIALDAVGSPNVAKHLDRLEGTGYKVAVTYVHRPIDESIMLAAKRAKTTTDPADQRVIPEADQRASHAKARASLGLLFKQGREVKVYDGTNHFDRSKPVPVIFHRLADGTVLKKDDAALQRMATSEEPKIPTSIFK